MKIKVSLYKSDLHGLNATWTGYQVDTVNQDTIPQKQGYIVQYYSEGSDSMSRTNIFGNKYKFQDMLQEKLNKGFYFSGNAELETETGVVKEVM
jgi:hypothetical protein